MQSPAPGKEEPQQQHRLGWTGWRVAVQKSTWGPWWGSKLNVSQHCVVAEKADNSNLSFTKGSRASRLKEVIIPFT